MSDSSADETQGGCVLPRGLQLSHLGDGLASPRPLLLQWLQCLVPECEGCVLTMSPTVSCRMWQHLTVFYRYVRSLTQPSAGWDSSFLTKTCAYQSQSLICIHFPVGMLETVDTVFEGIEFVGWYSCGMWMNRPLKSCWWMESVIHRREWAWGWGQVRQRGSYVRLCVPRTYTWWATNHSYVVGTDLGVSITIVTIVIYMIITIVTMFIYMTITIVIWVMIITMLMMLIIIPIVINDWIHIW